MRKIFGVFVGSLIIGVLFFTNTYASIQEELRNTLTKSQLELFFRYESKVSETNEYIFTTLYKCKNEFLK